MTVSYSATNVFNQCATCEFWGAPRKVRAGFFRRTVEVEDDIDAECLNRDSIFNRHQQPGGSGCSKWVKWSEIGDTG
jgi:hypothetical protein